MEPASVFKRGANAAALMCLSLLIFQMSVSFLPKIIIFHYITPTRLILLVGYAALMLRSILEKRTPPAHGRSTRILFMLAGAMLVWDGVSSIFSPTLISFSAMRLRIEEVLAMLLLATLVRDEAELKSMLLIILVAVSVVSLHALRQFADHTNTGYFLIHKTGWTVTETLAMPKGAIVRVLGYFSNPNVLSAYLVLMLPIAVCYAKISGSQKWVTALLAALSSLALIFTFSRGAVIALLAALGITLVKKRVILAVPLILLVAGVLVNPLSTGRIATGFTRIAAWSTAVQMIAEKPVVGVGPGNFHAYALNDLHSSFWHAHNLFLNAAAESGIMAGLLLLGIFGVAIASALQLSRRGGNGGFIGSALMISITGFCIASIIDDAYNTAAISYAFWLIIGLLAAAQRIYAHEMMQAPQEVVLPPADLEPESEMHSP